MTSNYLISPSEKNYYYDIVIIEELDVAHFEDYTKAVLAFLKYKNPNTPIIILNLVISMKFLSDHPSNPLNFKSACDIIKTLLKELSIEVITKGSGIETCCVMTRKRNEAEPYMTNENTIKYTK